MYELIFSREADADMKRLQRNEPQAFKKALKLAVELMEHPTTGTGHPHQLTGDRSGQWARSITKKHRMVYEIRDKEVVVLILSAYGHYEDK